MKYERIFTNKKFVASMAIFCCLLWGSAFPAIKNGYLMFGITVGDIPSKLVFAGYRFTMSGVILLVIATFLGKNIFKLSKGNFLQAIILGVLQTVLQYMFFYIGVANTTGVKSSIMTSTTTFFSVILAHFIYENDKLNKKKIVGCILGFSGVIIANLSPNLLDFSFSFKGEGFVVIAAFFSSLAAIYGKRITKNIDVIVITGYSLFTGGSMLTLLGRINGGEIHNFNIHSSSLLIYLALLSATTFFLWNVLLKYNKVGTVSIYKFLTPIFGVILSAIFLQEAIFQIKNIIALFLVCIGIWIVNKTQKEEYL